MDATERALLKGLVQVIWADGEVDQKEREMLGGILAQMGCSAEEIQEVAAMMMGERKEQVALTDLPDRESRREIMKVLLAMAMADDRIDVNEVRFLNKMANHLEIDEDDLEVLKAETVATLKSGG
ncbi:MAG: DUF533 domain-containing protein [Armatimonadetes bacterium]|nr:DUF533 domain-containing protein [Armatimonadota bacterium]